MVLIEVIFARTGERYYLEVRGDKKVSELSEMIREFFSRDVRGIYIPQIAEEDLSKENAEGSLTLKELGVHNGTGVIVTDGWN